MSNTAAASIEDIFGEVIYSYSRADALRDGVLVDVSTLASEYGVRWPVAMTAAAHLATVAWDERIEARKPGYTGQDETGRCWDVLTMMRRMLPAACEQAQQQGYGRVPFRVLCVPSEGAGVRARLTELALHVGPGDEGEPVITIMLPNED